MRYARFIAANARLLAFGFLLNFFSAFGQTFFIGVFGGALRTSFDLSHGELGLNYSLATLAAAGGFAWLGRWIDRVDLRLYAGLTCAVYVATCVFVAVMPALPALLFVAFALLRLTGQGLMSHIGVTTMARYFREARGRAVSVATLGFPAAEAVFPPAGAALLAAFGWRATWLAVGAGLAVMLVPLVLWLLRGHGERERRFRDAHAGEAGDGERHWLLAEVVRDPHFYLVLPAVLLTPFTVTGLFFHQAHLAASKGWSLGLFASAFAVYAATSLAGTLLAGPLIDRYGARRLVALFLAPLAGALLVLALARHPGAAFAFMAGAGLTAGTGLTLLGALWAEMYGVLHIGAIRSLVWALVVAASAIAPMLFGHLFDRGVGVAAIAAACCVVAGAASLLAGPGRRLPALAGRG